MRVDRESSMTTSRPAPQKSVFRDNALSSGDPDARRYRDTLQRVLQLILVTFTILRLQFSLQTCYFTALLGISSKTMEYVMPLMADRNGKDQTVVQTNGSPPPRNGYPSDRRQLHSVRRVETKVIATRKLSCFCPPCMDDTSDKCINKNFVDPWGTFKLNVSHTVAEDACRGDAVQERVPLPRNDYFSNLQSKMQTCKSYHELEMVVSASQASDYPLPDELPQTIVDVSGSIDMTALNLRPGTVSPDLYPVLTGGDGNCLPRAISLLLFGSESFHVEIRCRPVIELVKNSQLDWQTTNKSVAAWQHCLLFFKKMLPLQLKHQHGRT